jgi:two-component system, cell cycle sensor histidine kinase PleC
MLNKLFVNKHFKRIIVITLINIFFATVITLATIIFANSNTLDTLETFESFTSLFVINLILIFIFTLIMQHIYNKPGEKISKKDALNKKTFVDVQLEVERQNRLINTLASLYLSLIEYDNMKTEFYSNITHELKTPLTVILGAIQLSEQKKTELPSSINKSNKYLQTIKQNCYRLLRLINNILDLTRLDSGYFKVNFINCNIVHLIEEITMSVSSYSEQKGLALEFDTDKEEIVTGVDVDKFERIILNLLSNAIKFTAPGGKITVNIRNNKSNVIISIKDTGFGIPQDMQSIIFERFRQTNSSLTKNHEGSGIGLSIVKSFVELHGGIIKVKSEENMGSEFIIEIPIKLCETNEETNSSFINNNQCKIINSINIEFSDIYSSA